MRSILDDLISIGLTPGEARVFLSLLKLGSSRVGQIVKDSHVSYSKIYDVLNRLSSKGLVSHIMLGNVKYFNAVEPYRLEEYIKSKEQEVSHQLETANRVIPELAKIADKNRQNDMAEIFIGDKGIRTAYEVLLRDATSKDILYYFYPFEEYHPIASPFYSRLYLFQKQKKVQQRGIATLDFKKTKHYADISKGVKMKFVDFPLPATMDIFKNKLLIISWENATGILISSKEIAGHFRNYFDSMWKLATR
jgi:HTH-type transcriptional regulator, sugar sensing transcriptional regulator